MSHVLHILYGDACVIHYTQRTISQVSQLYSGNFKGFLFAARVCVCVPELSEFGNELDGSKVNCCQTSLRAMAAE